MTSPLNGRVAVVTGGARGIGAATAAALAGAGATVAIGDLDPDPDVAGQSKLDVTDRVAFTAFLDEVEQRLGPIDILVNNAGIMPLIRIEDEPDTLTARCLAVNLHAVIHGSREAVRRMKPRGRGHIINLASVAAQIAFPGGATYAATKAGVLGFCEALRVELRGSGVTASCVLPGLVATELAAGIDVRGYRPVGPDVVAGAIVGLVRRPRFLVYVPRSVGPTVKLGALAGRRFGDWLQRLSRADATMLNAIGSAEREAYERRAAGAP